MAYLNYYRQNPAWATNQWQSVAPPMPTFQPQPSWGGYDYFKSAVGSMNIDPGLYSYGYSNIANASNLASSVGTSMMEAKLQHRRAYGGLDNVLVMTPQAIGAAAAYEVWRNWRYHNGILAQPLAGDVPRQREALVGLAIGESARLWQCTRRLGDTAGQAAAAETAAIAAARIFDQGNAALVQAGGAYGSLGSTALSGAALSPVLSSVGVGGYGRATTVTPGANPVTAALAAAGSGAGAVPMARARSASFGSLPMSMSSYAAGAPALTSGVGIGGRTTYAGPSAGMYGGANGLLGAGTSMGVNRYGGGVGGGGMNMGMLSGSRPVSPVYPSANGLLGAGSSMGMGMGAGSNGYEGGADMLSASRPVSPAAYGGLAPGMASNFHNAPGILADGSFGGAVGRRLKRHALHKRERLAQRAELSAQRAGYGAGYGGYEGGGHGGGSYERAYDDIDGFGYGRKRRYFGNGRMGAAGGGYY